MSYCKPNEKVTVYYTINGVKKEVQIDKGSVDVTVGKVGDFTSATKCYRFSGQGKFNDSFYDFFACGSNPLWVDNGILLQPSFSGHLIFDSTFGVRYGSQSIAVTESDAARENYIAIGDCSRCFDKCILRVSSNGKLIYAESGDCPINFSVACGDGCPDGTMTCSADGYPGYYCLPCDSLESQVSNMIQQIKKLNT